MDDICRLGYSSGVEHLPSIYSALNVIPSTPPKKKKTFFLLYKEILHHHHLLTWYAQKHNFGCRQDGGDCYQVSADPSAFPVTDATGHTFDPTTFPFCIDCFYVLWV